MKKFLTFVLVGMLCIVMMLSFTGCAFNNNYTDKYEYSGAYVNSTIASEFATSQELFEYVYEDTCLKLFDDGKWVIDYNIFLFINSNIDEGTYTVEDGVYKFEGFEYGLSAYGEKTDEGFEIYFMMPDGYTYIRAFSIYYKK